METSGVSPAIGRQARLPVKPFLGLDRDDWIIIGTLLVLAAATRFHQLGSISLSHNEGITFECVSGSLTHLLRDTIKGEHVPTCFLLVRPWVALVESEFLLRAPSAIFNVLTIPMWWRDDGAP